MFPPASKHIKNINVSTTLIIFLLSVFAIQSSQAEGLPEAVKNQTSLPSILSPQWSEFCNGLYCESPQIELPEIKERPTFGSIVLGTFVPVLLPSVYKKEGAAARSEQAWVKAVEQNYWVGRRKQFETEITQCQQVQANDKLVDCYMNLRQMETNKNQAYRQETLMRQQIKAINSLYSPQ